MAVRGRPQHRLKVYPGDLDYYTMLCELRVIALRHPRCMSSKRRTRIIDAAHGIEESLARREFWDERSTQELAHEWLSGKFHNMHDWYLEHYEKDPPVRDYDTEDFEHTIYDALVVMGIADDVTHPPRAEFMWGFAGDKDGVYDEIAMSEFRSIWDEAKGRSRFRAVRQAVRASCENWRKPGV